MIWLGMLALGLVAGTLSGIVGFGASIMLMPVLMLAFGPQEAVPIMAIAALLANFSRVLVWWRDIDWRANAYYCVTAIPMAALGARTLLVLDPRVVEGVLGGLFLLMIPARRWLFARGMRIEAWHLTLVGAVIGFLSGMVASTGPDQHPVLSRLRPGEGRLSRHGSAGLHGDRPDQGNRVPALRRAAAWRRWRAGFSSAPA